MIILRKYFFSVSSLTYLITLTYIFSEAVKDLTAEEVYISIMRIAVILNITPRNIRNILYF